MKAACTLVLACVMLTLAPAAASGETNVEGVSGILAIPTAEVAREGEAVLSVGRYLNDALVEGEEHIARVYSASVGYLPGLEITARFADYPGRPDPMEATNYADRSVSAKYQLWTEDCWSFALGALDIGGEAKRNQAYYGVVDYQGTPEIRVSLGAGTDKFEGVFGGVQYSPLPFLSLLGEYDTRQLNYGLEVRPHKGVVLKGGVVDDHVALTASYSFPLDPRGKSTPCCPVVLVRSIEDCGDPCDQAALVRDALAAESFENVLVGVSEDTLFVEYENRRFREQLDGLAVAAALAAQRCGPGIEWLAVSPKLDDVPQLSLLAPVDELLRFLAEPGTPAAGIHVSPYLAGGYPAGTVFAQEGRKKPGGGEVLLRLTEAFEITRPGEPTFASRTGLGLEERVFLGRGLRLTARQDWPAHNDLTDKTDPVNRDAFLQYSGAWSPHLFILARGGYFGGERYGGLAEAGYYFANGRYRVGGRYAYTKDESPGEADPEDGLALGEVAYFEPALDWELSALGGQFMEGDRGLRVTSRRYFGPTELTFFAYDTDESEPHGGFGVYIPLPWYWEQRHDSWRAAGSPYFGYQYRTDSDPSGMLALPGADLEHARERLRPDYVAAHMDEFRRAVALFFSEH